MSTIYTILESIYPSTHFQMYIFSLYQVKLDTLVDEVGEIREEYELAKSAADNYIGEAEATLAQAKSLSDQVSRIQ